MSLCEAAGACMMVSPRCVIYNQTTAQLHGVAQPMATRKLKVRFFVPSSLRWRRSYRRLRQAAGLGVLVLAPASAEETDGGAQSVEPLDLYRTVAHFQLDLEMLRWVMGDPKLAASPWQVSDAAPRHLLWQAEVMFRKASQFAEEVAGPRTLPLPPGSWRRSLPRPAPLDRDPQLADVLRIVVDAHDRIRAIITLQKIHMVERQRPERDAAKTPADVLAQIVQANRQLNLLLHRQIPPRDAYNRLMAAVDRAGDLLGGYYPPPPPLVIGQSPDDAYRRIITCFGLLRQAAPRELRALGLDLERELSRQGVRNADVFHLATTLLSDLDHMATQLGSETTKPPKGEYPVPQFVFPSHVQQLGAVLETQLRTWADAQTADGAG